MECGKLERIWIKRMHRGPMDLRAEAVLEEGRGLVGNANQGGRRQVTLLDQAAWGRAIEELGCDVDPSARRANLLISGLALAHTRGRVLQVGACRLAVLGETRPCEMLDEACLGLRAALEKDWRGGVFAQVLDGGTIRVGDAVLWESS